MVVRTRRGEERRGGEERRRGRSQSAVGAGVTFRVFRPSLDEAVESIDVFLVGLCKKVAFNLISSYLH